MSFHHHGCPCLDVSWRLWFPFKPLPILYQGEDSSPPPLALCFPLHLPPPSSVGLRTKLPGIHTFPGHAAYVGLSKISVTASSGAQCDSNASNVPLQPATSLLHRLFSTERVPVCCLHLQLCVGGAESRSCSRSSFSIDEREINQRETGARKQPRSAQRGEGTKEQRHDVRCCSP